MTPQEEDDYLAKRYAEACDDCGHGADDHAVGITPAGDVFADCTND